MAYKKKTKKIKRQVDSAVAHVKSTFNNTLVSITTTEGDVFLRSSAGRLGFKGARKGTPFAAASNWFNTWQKKWQHWVLEMLKLICKVQVWKRFSCACIPSIRIECFSVA